MRSTALKFKKLRVYLKVNGTNSVKVSSRYTSYYLIASGVKVALTSSQIAGEFRVHFLFVS